MKLRTTVLTVAVALLALSAFGDEQMMTAEELIDIPNGLYVCGVDFPEGHYRVEFSDKAGPLMWEEFEDMAAYDSFNVMASASSMGDPLEFYAIRGRVYWIQNALMTRIGDVPEGASNES